MWSINQTINSIAHWFIVNDPVGYDDREITCVVHGILNQLVEHDLVTSYDLDINLIDNERVLHVKTFYWGSIPQEARLPLTKEFMTVYGVMSE